MLEGTNQGRAGKTNEDLALPQEQGQENNQEPQEQRKRYKQKDQMNALSLKRYQIHVRSNTLARKLMKDDKNKGG